MCSFFFLILQPFCSCCWCGHSRCRHCSLTRFVFFVISCVVCLVCSDWCNGIVAAFKCLCFDAYVFVCLFCVYYWNYEYLVIQSLSFFRQVGMFQHFNFMFLQFRHHNMRLQRTIRRFFSKQTNMYCNVIWMETLLCVIDLLFFVHLNADKHESQT